MAALLAGVILAGCGSASSSEQAAFAPPVTNVHVAESALQRLRAPAGFRLDACTYLSDRAYTRCYRRNGFAPLNPAKFAALIIASGLTPDQNTVACPRFLRARAGNAIRRDACQARASGASVEFAAFATSLKVRIDALEPSDRQLAAKRRGTVFELTVVATHA